MDAVWSAVRDGCPALESLDAEELIDEGLVENAREYLRECTRRSKPRDRASAWRKIADTALLLDEHDLAREAQYQAAMSDLMRGDARYKFFLQLFDIWRAAGGKIRASRHPTTQAPSGPFVRFLAVITEAVMGPDAPALETIYKLIRAEKREEIEDELRAEAQIKKAATGQRFA